ncbi:unnamed protein product [Cylicocyclus nassatus]|uniref:Uncharacterized protein n=1 Tax=Cylicocyclus nassatus TaxID=53992 RepID=A0AA36GL20_CYLNA|nr:unnamed protein product [Cylicocyclus nassatus]
MLLCQGKCPMSSTGELTPANVIAQAIIDIVAVGSQELREECLRASGSQNMDELSRTVEKSLTSFFKQATKKQRPKVVASCTSTDQTLMCMSCGNVSSCSALQRSYAESDLHDFSSADEEHLDFSTTITDDGFHTPPPAEKDVNADPFSPALGLLAPRKTSVSVNDCDDFSQDEGDPLEKQVEHSQTRCARNLQISGFVADDLWSTVRSHQVQAMCECELSDFSD